MIRPLTDSSFLLTPLEQVDCLFGLFEHGELFRFSEIHLEWLSTVQFPKDLKIKIHIQWAKTIILRIENPVDKILALLEIFKTEIEMGLDSAWNTLAAAKNVCCSISNLALQIELFAKIIKAEAEANPDQALESAFMIPFPFGKAKALLEVVNTMIVKASRGEVQLDQLKKTLSDIEAIVFTVGNLRDQTLLYLELVRITFEIDSAKARIMLNRVITLGIDDADVKSEIHFEAAKLLMELEKDFFNARNMILKISNHQFHYLGILEYTKNLAKDDFYCAKKFARARNFFRDEALLEIVKIEVKFDLDEAKKTAFQIQHPYIRSLALFEIFRVELENNLLIHASLTLGVINDPSIKNLAILEVIKESARIDLEEAQAMAEMLSDLQIRDQAYLEIVISAASKKDLILARAAMKFLSNPLLQIRAHLVIITAISKST